MLAAWSSSPTRFREDVNAEDDLRRGGYAETWVAELLQNAADAAAAGAAPGRVLARVHDGELRIANTGAPLDAAGVAALAALRASAKRDATGATGRFGVGFAAVLAVCSQPRLVTAQGAIAFSAERTAAEVTALGGAAADELARDPRVPVLRLCWPTSEEPPPDGYATEIRLRPDSADPATLLAELAVAAADLLLALPALGEVAAGDTVLTRSDLGGGRIRIGDRELLLAGGPARWALPYVDGRPVPYPPDAGEVLHAPTPSAEQLSLPARLLAPFPLDPDRRRIRADDPGTGALVERAAHAFTELIGVVEPHYRTMLVPEPGFPRSPLDGLLRTAIAAALGSSPWLPAAGGGVLAPDRAEYLDLGGDTPTGLPELLAAADPAFDRLVASGVVPPPGLHVDRLGPAALTERLTGVDAGPSWWRELYATLAPAVDAIPGLAAELGALPVPLTDGRLVPGPATVLLADGATPDLPELRTAHPDAAHPLLRRLGAADADRETLLASPALLDAVERSVDDAEAGLDTEPLARAVLALLDTPSAARDPRFGALALTDDDGVPARADELVLPGSPVRDLLDPDAPVGILDARWLDAGKDALVAAGVLDRFVVVDFDPEVLHDADRYDAHRADAERCDADGAEASAVRDLDLVDDDAWPAALALLAADRDTRAAMLTGYTAWWLSRNVRIGGRLPSTWRLPSASTLAGLYDPVPPLDGLGDDAILVAIGVRSGITIDGADEAVELLDRLADPARPVTGDVAGVAHTALAAALRAGVFDLDDLDPPDHVRTLTGEVAPADRAVVVDMPWVLPALDDVPAVPGGDDPDALAELLDLPVASARVTGIVRGAGEPVAWTAVAEVVLACRAIGVDPPEGELRRHERLAVELDDGGTVTVPAWPGADGGWHASDPLRALVAELAAQRRVRMMS
ncbi:hypothetical protein C8E95_3256 [Pseudonocardia autotrophica]|uniref:Molecular chaperone Hsp90 n=2 Tax=Pseudonocardia TaxID=1847 RepID=A0A1Y2N9H9_PSEAH|nr:hypothetical protein BG845_00251 [Pseudonocardia autotrophica]TDN74140.1 hypothetical protein C8E95_3256 [Pseudonocardia autotrophica]BBG04899.1 molecular chaperone Hsp90 [Pseudonocardia autotrophica]GEC23555.1 molecular chaperone Hsp90 [Pseudonocardia saturnea]